MKIKLFIFLALLVSVLCSCRALLDFYVIPNVIYGCWQNVDEDEILCEKYNLFKDGTFEYYSIDDLSRSLEPSASITGTYSPEYDVYKVTSASGKVKFTPADESIPAFTKNFYWQASQEEGPLRLVLYTDEFKWEYRWAEVNK